MKANPRKWKLSERRLAWHVVPRRGFKDSFGGKSDPRNPKVGQRLEALYCGRANPYYTKPVVCRFGMHGWRSLKRAVEWRFKDTNDLCLVLIEGDIVSGRCPADRDKVAGMHRTILFSVPQKTARKLYIDHGEEEATLMLLARFGLR